MWFSMALPCWPGNKQGSNFKKLLRYIEWISASLLLRINRRPVVTGDFHSNTGEQWYSKEVIIGEPKQSCRWQRTEVSKTCCGWDQQGHTFHDTSCSAVRKVWSNCGGGNNFAKISRSTKISDNKNVRWKNDISRIYHFHKIYDVRTHFDV